MSVLSGRRSRTARWGACVAVGCCAALCTGALLGAAEPAADMAKAPLADANTISLLHLDETEGTVVKDAAGKGNDATFDKAPRTPEWYAHGRFGGCLLFDGNNADADGDKQGDADSLIWPKGANADPNGSGFTAEMWVRPARVKGWQFLLTQGSGYYFIIKEASLFATVKPAAQKAWVELTSKPCVQADVWQHVAITYDAKALRLFHNGVEVAKLDLPAMPTAGRVTIVGRDGDVRPGQIRGFAGLMDEMRISNIARTDFPKAPYTPKDPMPTPKD